MKRILSLTLCAALLLTTAFSVPYQSSEGSLRTIAAASVTAQPGDYISVPITLENDSTEEVFIIDRLRIDFDSTALEWATIPYTDGRLGDFTPEVPLNAFTESYGHLDLVSSELGTLESGVLITFHFKVKENAPSGNIPLAISVGYVTNYDLDFIDCSLVSGNVKIIRYGDATNTGVINASDATFLRSYLANYENLPNYFNYDNADVNGDGVIDDADLELLRRYLAATDPTTVILGPPTTLTLNISTNNEYTIALEADALSTAPNTYTIKYDPAALQLLDFAAQIGMNITTPGAVVGTPLTIVSHSDGTIVFSVAKGTPNGLVTVVRFKAIVTGTTDIFVGG